MAAAVQAQPQPLSLPHRDYLPSKLFATAQYVLPSDDKERNRLLLQHSLLKGVFEDRIVLPPIAFEYGSRVLDSGTGSGTWILDFASRYSLEVSLLGTDIEPRLFPSASERPPNADFQVASVTNLSDVWTDTFHLVNQRLLIAALRKEEWEAAVREIRRVLVPGGWIQLGEAGVWKAGPITERHHDLARTLFASRGLLLDDCAVSLPPLLEQAGFEDIHVERRTIPLGKLSGQTGMDGRDNFIEVFRGMKTPVLKSGGFGYVKDEEEFDRLLDEVEKEWDNTPDASIGFAIVYGRKSQ